jgi:hypothetical protein
MEQSVIVVRTDDAGETDFKAFATREGASAHFYQEFVEVMDGAYQRVAAYDVPEATDAKAAIDAVRNADSSIRLLRIEESDATRLERIVREIGPGLEFKL